jgi:hypothetical protein
MTSKRVTDPILIDERGNELRGMFWFYEQVTPKFLFAFFAASATALHAFAIP